MNVVVGLRGKKVHRATGSWYPESVSVACDRWRAFPIKETRKTTAAVNCKRCLKVKTV